MSKKLKIMVLNRSCGLITAFAARLIAFGHNVKFIETKESNNTDEDLEETKHRIESFDPDYILQQNFNVYVLTNHYGVKLLEWISDNKYKQIIWFLSRPDNIGKPELLHWWMDNGFLDNVTFLCASKEIESYFKGYGQKTVFFPTAILESYYHDKSDSIQHEDQILYWNEIINIPPAGSTYDDLFKNPLNLSKLSLYALTKIFQSKEELKGQESKVVNSVFPPIHRYFSTTHYDIKSFLQSRDECFTQLKKVLPNEVFRSVKFIFGHIDNAYKDMVSYSIFRDLQNLVDAFSGSACWSQFEPQRSLPFEPGLKYKHDTLKNYGCIVTHTGFFSWHGVNELILQIFLSGSVVISEYRTEFKDVIPFDNVLTFTDKENLLDVMEMYKTNTKKYRHQIKDIQNHILKNHTLEVRARQLLDLLS